MNFSAIIVAAGTGTRAGPGISKAWRSLGGRDIVAWSVEAFARAGASEIMVVVAADFAARASETFSDYQKVRVVTGGPTRASSVRAGLAALGASDAVLIHDAARPLVSTAHIASVLRALETHDGAVLALPLADTLKRQLGHEVETLARDGLWRAQTPQGFHTPRLRQAYDRWPEGAEPTDDAGVLERDGGSVALVPGDPRLMKLTYPEDFAMAEQMITGSRRTQIGQGVDAHRWGPGASVWLCGVEIPHHQTLIGHSDADAGLHALTDALLGAIGAGDIGDHFPPSDPQWKGVSSDRFLVHAVRLVAEAGGRIGNVDLTLICEQPRIGPHRQAMRERLATLLVIPVGRVSVKATTTEGMGFTGRGEGLMAQAIVTVDLPAD